MSSYIMDANSLLVSLRNEPGGAVAEGLLADSNADCLAHSVNLCEIFYDTLRRTDLATAQLTINDLFALGVTERPDIDTAFWELIGQLKVNPGKISLADCFALALCPILFIR